MAEDEKFTGLSDEEKAAMKERTKELKAEAKRGKSADKAAKDEAAVLEKIAEMSDADRALAERIHQIVKDNAPSLAPKTWYGMPAYAKDGKVVCFFTSAEKFNTRYATFGFEAAANLDDGTMWPTAFAVTELTADDETKLADLVRKAAS
ncbi:MAG: iron chaperone [Nocardioides sp.]